MLVMKAPALKARGIKPRMGEFDYLGYLQTLSGRGSRIASNSSKARITLLRTGWAGLQFGSTPSSG